jgi:nickel-dependent lactate racemase
LVKTLHSIEDLAKRISAADDRRVRLTRETGGPPAGSVDVEPRLDATAAVIRALAEPLDYPPLAAATVPGDHVAIALDEAMPCAMEILQGAVEAFRQAGVEADAITVVTVSDDACRLFREQYAGQMNAVPHFVVHDPEDESNLCPVGVTNRGEPLLVNRTIFDADIVLPIGVARVDDRGAYDTMFPRFSSLQTVERYQSPSQSGSAEHAAQKREADEAGWLIGAPLSVRVVPGANESVAQVVAGEAQAVALRSQELCRRRWLLHSPQQVGLVIATITGGAPSQTWYNVGRALAAAEQLLGDGGAIALCTNLEEPPGESLSRLAGSGDLAKTERKIGLDRGEHTWPAWHLVRALQRGPVYLLSQLAAETVEDMGLAPVADIGEIARLAGRHDSFALIEDSQHAVARLDE